MSNSQSMIIIQLTRTGDLIQTYQAAKMLKFENPNLRLSLIARETFAQGILFLLEDVFEDIHLINTKELFKNKSFLSAQEHTQKLIENFNQKLYSVSVNLSFCKSSGYINRLLNAKIKMGVCRNNRGEVTIADKWSQYIYSSVLDSSLNPFNLVTLYSKILGVKEQHSFTQDTERSNHVVIHPFASHVRKRWGANKWIEVIYKLLKESDCDIYIVGSADDMSESEKIMGAPSIQNYKDRLKSLVGTSSIESVHNLLVNSKLFIGHDSMVSHLASITNTPTIVLSLGTVRPHETSAFQNNIINLVPKSRCFPCSVTQDCKLFPCHSDIHQQVVSEIALEILDTSTNEEKLLNISSFHLMNVKVLQSFIDENNNYYLEDLNREHMSKDEAMRVFYNYIFSLILDSNEVNLEIPTLNKEANKQFKNLLNGLNYLFELYSFGAKFSKNLLKESKKVNSSSEKINSIINKINEIDELFIISKKSFPELSIIINFFHVAKANVQGNNLTEITENYLLNYHDATNVCKVLDELIQQTSAIGDDISQRASEV